MLNSLDETTKLIGNRIPLYSRVPTTGF